MLGGLSSMLLVSYLAGIVSLPALMSSRRFWSMSTQQVLPGWLSTETLIIQPNSSVSGMLSSVKRSPYMLIFM